MAWAIELCAPYVYVVDIHRAVLLSPDVVARWDGVAFIAALRHDSACNAYDSDLRQLLHVGCRIAAEMGRRYIAALEQHFGVIAANITTTFPGGTSSPYSSHGRRSYYNNTHR